VSKAESASPPNKGLQRTAHCANKIGAILKLRFGSKALLIYGCAAAEAQAVGRWGENLPDSG
jgi:hypothetical protein